MIGIVCAFFHTEGKGFYSKTKLILVYVNGEWSAGQFAKNINNILGKSGLKMKDVATIANCTECISD